MSPLVCVRQRSFMPDYDGEVTVDVLMWPRLAPTTTVNGQATDMGQLLFQ